VKEREIRKGNFVEHVVAIDLLGVHTLHGSVPTTAPRLPGDRRVTLSWLWRAGAAAACESSHARGPETSTWRNGGCSFAVCMEEVR
jgi:hypothetical protein